MNGLGEKQIDLIGVDLFRRLNPPNTATPILFCYFLPPAKTSLSLPPPPPPLLCNRLSFFSACCFFFILVIISSISLGLSLLTGLCFGSIDQIIRFYPAFLAVRLLRLRLAPISSIFRASRLFSSLSIPPFIVRSRLLDC